MSDVEKSMDPEVWVEEYGDQLFRYAYVRLGDKATAEDAVQETMLAAFKGKDRFDGRSPVKHWLMGILKHKIVDHIRKASREVKMEDVELAAMQDDFNFKHFGITTRNPSAWQFDPREACERSEFMDVLTECVSKLKGNTQAVFTLRELEGQSTEEICKLLDVRPNNLWVIIHRARAQLKACLEVNWLHKDVSE